MNYLVVGLGNIGAEYALTRHNIGFMILDAWAQASNISFQTGRYGDMAECSFKGRKFHLLKPSTYMNLSGNAVRYWLTKLSVPIENLVVVCDDLNLPFGAVRMRKSGSNGGHNGLANIIEMIGTKDFTRIRIGIGNEFSRGEQVDYVLGRFSSEEIAAIEKMSPRIIDGIKTLSVLGVDRAMNFINTKASQDLQL